MIEPESQRDLLVVAGEASGDTHAAELLAELRRVLPGVRAFGLGGHRLEAAGLELVARSSEISVVGLTEAVRIVPRALRIFRALLEQVDRRGARVAVLVDFPEFNLRLARALKKRGVRVVYYVSPQIWAWRRGRVKAIAERVDRMLVLFPFETDFYREHDVDVRHVGHPLLDQVPERRSLPAASVEEGLTLTLLPGSRPSEVRAHLPVMAEAVRLLRDSGPVRARWVVAPEMDPDDYRSLLPTGLELEPVVSDRFESIAGSDLCLCASGTATLEVGLLETPMIVVYRVSALTYRLGRWLVDLPNISLVNLVLGSEVVPELIQERASGASIAAECRSLLGDPQRLERMRSELGTLRSRLGEPGAAGRAARVVQQEFERLEQVKLGEA